MATAAIPETEANRLEMLKRTRLLGAEAEESFYALTRSIAHATGAPIAALSLIDLDCQRLFCRVGIDASEMPRDVSLCAHTILETEPLVVDNAFNDRRFFNNPCVTGPPHIRAYLGAPLIVDGAAIGALCAADVEPRQWSDANVALMRELASVVVALIGQRTMRFDLFDAIRTMSPGRRASA